MAGDDHRSLVGQGRDDSVVGVCPGDPIGFQGYSVEQVEGTESSQLVGVEVGCIRGAEGDLRCGRHVSNTIHCARKTKGAADAKISPAREGSAAMRRCSSMSYSMPPPRG